MGYMTLPSLEQYMVIDQGRMRADVYCRKEGQWGLSILREPDQVLRFNCLDCAVTLAQLYSGAEFPLHVAEEELEVEWLTG